MSADFREDYKQETLERLTYELKRIALELELLDKFEYATSTRSIFEKLIKEQSC
jgi:hypothetical protein